ncbi:MAG: bifunctional diaminohydroxyphosphoribosylaminopyrimidine deaminase/5-amino-6-(5-phosphoribosylamino)uracil reductase RibD, partial [Wenzhouxiangella sp.]|nr:bifunctional diaminohydroxyphosphoribosylaminopyrimidine deaminase/5-amino-6-(5-phosphoribosylamino)uracil reductase RibD [Wenzhouxiangella sp.]
MSRTTEPGVAFSEFDQACMREALMLAEKGLWTTDPNPRVGCVIAHDQAVVGRGWHRAAGEPHAEVLALQEAGGYARGATAYVTLEPCSHIGRTPPCTQALIGAGIKRVVAAIKDPNPAVSGSGFRQLKDAGILVETGLMAEQARDLNPGFISRHERGRPWLRVKMAISLDGLTAAADGRSQWITGAEARADGHRWRARASAILTGIGTVLADDPQLNARTEGVERQPARVVADSKARLPRNSRLLQSGEPVWVATTRAGTWQDAAVRWQQLPASEDGRLNLHALVTCLADLEFNEVHVEAGPTLAGALVSAGLVDEFLVYQAPVLLGSGRPMLHLPGMENFDDRLHLERVEQRQ